MGRRVRRSDRAWWPSRVVCGRQQLERSECERVQRRASSRRRPALGSRPSEGRVPGRNGETRACAALTNSVSARSRSCGLYSEEGSQLDDRELMRTSGGASRAQAARSTRSERVDRARVAVQHRLSASSSRVERERGQHREPIRARELVVLVRSLGSTCFSTSQAALLHVPTPAAPRHAPSPTPTPALAQASPAPFDLARAHRLADTASASSTDLHQAAAPDSDTDRHGPR